MSAIQIYARASSDFEGSKPDRECQLFKDTTGRNGSLCKPLHSGHTTAMHLLQSGVPFNVIALWLGHESTTTTHRYVEADLAMKEKALARLEAPDTQMRRYRAPDSLMKFLQ